MTTMSIFKRPRPSRDVTPHQLDVLAEQLQTVGSLVERLEQLSADIARENQVSRDQLGEINNDRR